MPVFNLRCNKTSYHIDFADVFRYCTLQRALQSEALDNTDKPVSESNSKGEHFISSWALLWYPRKPAAAAGFKLCAMAKMPAIQL